MNSNGRGRRLCVIRARPLVVRTASTMRSRFTIRWMSIERVVLNLTGCRPELRASTFSPSDQGFRQLPMDTVGVTEINGSVTQLQKG